MKASLKDIIQLIIFTSIGAVILWLLWTSQSAAYTDQCQLDGIPAKQCNLWKKLISDFRSSNIFWLIVVCLTYMVANVCRALRWQQMLSPLDINPKFHNAFFTTMAAYFINLGLPRSGEFARGGLLAKYEDKPFDKIFGTIILDRVFDFISLFIMLGLGFLLAYEELWSYISRVAPQNIMDDILLYLGVAAFLGICTLGGLIYFLRKTSNTQNKLLSKVNNIINGLWNGIKSIKDVKNIPLFILYSIGIWLAYFLMNYFMFFAFEPTAHLGMIDALLVFDFGALGIVFPSPGGMGTYHAMIMEALNIAGIDKINGFSFAMILFFTINAFCNIFFGLLGLILLPILNAKK